MITLKMPLFLFVFNNKSNIYSLHKIWETQTRTKNNIYIVCNYTAAAAKSLQSCPTLCDPIDGSPPGSPVPGILQATTLEWVAISFSNAWKWKVKVKSLSHVRLFETRWTAAYQAPPSMGFSRQEYWSGVPLPSPVIILLFVTDFFPMFFLFISKYCCIVNIYLKFLKNE